MPGGPSRSSAGALGERPRRSSRGPRIAHRCGEGLLRGSAPRVARERPRTTRRRAATTTRAGRPRGSRARCPGHRASPRRAEWAPSPGDAGDELAALGEPRSVTGRDLGRVAPGGEVVTHVADRVAHAEAPAGRRARPRDPAGAHGVRGPRAGARRSRPRGRLGRRPAGRREACFERASAPRTRASRTSRPRARPPGSRSGCWVARPPTSAGRRVDAREDVVGRRVHRRAALDHVRPSSANMRL